MESLLQDTWTKGPYLFSSWNEDILLIRTQHLSPRGCLHREVPLYRLNLGNSLWMRELSGIEVVSFPDPQYMVWGQEWDWGCSCLQGTWSVPGPPWVWGVWSRGHHRGMVQSPGIPLDLAGEVRERQGQCFNITRPGSHFMRHHLGWGQIVLLGTQSVLSPNCLPSVMDKHSMK